MLIKPQSQKIRYLSDAVLWSLCVTALSCEMCASQSRKCNRHELYKTAGAVQHPYDYWMYYIFNTFSFLIMVFCILSLCVQEFRWPRGTVWSDPAGSVRIPSPILGQCVRLSQGVWWKTFTNYFLFLIFFYSFSPLWSENMLYKLCSFYIAKV